MTTVSPRRPAALPLDPFEVYVRASVGSAEAFAAIVFAGCWLPSQYQGDERIVLRQGESLRDAALRLQLGWNPAWPFEAAFQASDAAGVLLPDADTPCSVAGAVNWSPTLRLPRLDDQTGDTIAKWS